MVTSADTVRTLLAQCVARGAEAGNRPDLAAARAVLAALG